MLKIRPLSKELCDKDTETLHREYNRQCVPEHVRLSSWEGEAQAAACGQPGLVDAQ